MVFAAIIFGLFFHVSANTCPTSKSLPPLAVQDQDGLGTCASNVASLVMQHNLKLAKPPSYLQMSITSGGHQKDEFFTEGSEGVESFNEDAFVCSALNSSLKHGYCDADRLGFESHGTGDYREEQKLIIHGMASFLQQNLASIRRLKNLVNNPHLRAEGERYMAHLFSRQGECQNTFKAQLEDLVFARLRRHLYQELAAASTEPERRKLEAVISRTFNQNGDPALLATQTLHSLRAPLAVPLGTPTWWDTAAGEIGAINFQAEWARHLRTVMDTLATENNSFDYSAWVTHTPCRTATKTRLVLTEFLDCPECQIASANPISDEQLREAGKLMSGIARLANQTLDPEAGLINVISPACAEQMTQRDQQAERCEEPVVDNVGSARANYDKIHRELCAGRAVGVSVCTGFLAAAFPVNSNFCKTDVPGVANHGRHAVTVVGYRPKANSQKRQLLIQNSWGPACPFVNHPSAQVPAALKNSVECEIRGTTSGPYTGRFWVDEDLIMNNTYRVSFFKPTES